MALKRLLEIQDLRISFGSVKAVNGVNLVFEEGEFLALVGEGLRDFLDPRLKHPGVDR